MKAFGLEDMTYAKGLVRKLLQGGVASGSSLANTLNDARYRRLAATFDFAADGAATTQSQAVAKTTVSAYVEQTLESRVGKDNPGTGMALYFRRMAPDIKSAYGILADKTLLGVIQTAFSLSPSMSQQPIERQAATIDRFVKIADLQSPQKVQKLIERFTANYDANQPAQAAAAPTSALGVTSPGISPALLLSIANLRTGGI